MKMRLSLLAKAVAEHDEGRSTKYLGDVNDALTSAYTSLRELLKHFRSRMDPQGLLHALTVTANRYYEKTGVELKFENNAPEITLPVEQELQVFHIVNEALANVSRHSGARHARLAVDRHNGYCEVTVEDDGRGVPVPHFRGKEQRPRGESHYGLSIMRERASRIGGELRIEERAGGGTRVCLRFPVADVGQKAAQ
jgi:two-component system nitrate/nitrite sensor histidine kinase NarX